MDSSKRNPRGPGEVTGSPSLRTNPQRSQTSDPAAVERSSIPSPPTTLGAVVGRYPQEESIA